MTAREMCAVLGLVLAASIGVADMAVAQDRPHHRQHQRERLCTPGDTIRGRVLGHPVRPDGMRRHRMDHRRMMRARMNPGGPMGGFGMMHGMMGGPGMMHGFGMRGPAAILAHREELGLTPDQVQRLEVIAATQKRTLEGLAPQAVRGVADLMEAATGEIDIDAARAAHDRLARVHSEMMVARLQSVKDAREVLTPGQRTRWDALTSIPGGAMRPMRMMRSRAPGMDMREEC